MAGEFRGAPQGLILRSMLFLAFTSDLVAEIKQHCYLFAGDGTFCMIIRRVQTDLKTIFSWASGRGIGKCIYLGAQWKTFIRHLNAVTRRNFRGQQERGTCGWSSVGPSCSQTNTLVCNTECFARNFRLATTFHKALAYPQLEYMDGHPH